MIYISIQKFDEPKEVPVRTDSWIRTGKFLEDFLSSRNWTDIENLYCLEQERFLNLDQDFLENRIVFGDHLIAC